MLKRDDWTRVLIPASVAGGLAVVTAALIGLLVWLPPYQALHVAISGDNAAKLRAELIDEYRRTLAQVIGGIVVAAGALTGGYFTWRQISLSRAGQITDRFAKAIAQLGDQTNIAVRLGGIYALERIAKDSAIDQCTIVEILTAFIRENAPARKQGAITEGFQSPRQDVQAALTVLGRRPNRASQLEAPVNLAETDLTRANLSGCHFEGADFRRARLERADLSDATIDDAIFNHADLRGARLFRTSAKGAYFHEAHMEFAHFWKADLQGSTFWSARFQDASVFGSQLEGANFSKADLSRACFNEARIKHVSFVDATMDGTRFWDTQLEGARFFDGLESVDLSRAVGLSPDQLRLAQLSSDTRLPIDVLAEGR